MVIFCFTCILLMIMIVIWFLSGRTGVAEGSSELYLEFLTYDNPSDTLADGTDCDFTSVFDASKNLCDHIFQFCVSSKGRRYG